MKTVLGTITVLLAAAGAACTPAQASSNTASGSKPIPQGPLPAVYLLSGRGRRWLTC